MANPPGIATYKGLWYPCTCMATEDKRQDAPEIRLYPTDVNGPTEQADDVSFIKSSVGGRYDVEVRDKEPRFSAQEYATLLDWFMVSDPWPLEQTAHDRIKGMLNAEAKAREYDDWVQAYHEMGGDA